MHRSHLSRRRLKGGFLHSKLGDRLLDKELWAPTRESVARGWLVGFPITIIPLLPAQSVFAVVAGFFVRGNLFLCIALQFLSNWLTAPVHLPVCYFVGEMVQGHDIAEAWGNAPRTLKASVSGPVVLSIYLGAFVLGFVIGPVGYAIIRKTWKPTVSKRQMREALKLEPPTPKDPA